MWWRLEIFAPHPSKTAKGGAAESLGETKGGLARLPLVLIVEQELKHN